MDQTEAQRQLAGMARQNLAHLAAGTIERAPAHAVQAFLLEQEPTDEARAAAKKFFQLLGFVVREEDNAGQQRARASEPARDVPFGRNEGGGQRFRCWLDRLLAQGDEALANALPGDVE